MIRHSLLIIVAAVAFSCSNTSNNDEANAALVANYIQAVENLDYEAMSEFLADDYMGVGPSYSDTTDKDNAVINWRYNVENVYESIQYSRSKVIPVTFLDGENKGEWVLNWAELEVFFKDNDNVVKIFTNSVYLIENGKIKKSVTFYNEADVLEQLGFVVVDPSIL
jgi:ketosteroid isomerase-like protein